MAEQPFTVSELTARGVPLDEACMIAWPVTEEVFAAFLRSRREKSADEVERTERQRDAERGPYVPHGGAVHHTRDESRH